MSNQYLDGFYTVKKLCLDHLKSRHTSKTSPRYAKPKRSPRETFLQAKKDLYSLSIFLFLPLSETLVKQMLEQTNQETVKHRTHILGIKGEILTL